MDNEIKLDAQGFEIFCSWYKEHFKTTEAKECVFVTCMCGYFHTYSKRANDFIRSCKDVGIIDLSKGIVMLK